MFLYVVLWHQADNAGFDATDLLNRLRQKHARDGDAGKWFGVDVDTEGKSSDISILWRRALTVVVVVEVVVVLRPLPLLLSLLLQ